MRLRYHPRFAEMVWSLNKRVNPKLAIGDAQYVLDGNGPMAGSPVYLNRLIVANDILAFDTSAASRLMHLRIDSIGYLEPGRRLGYAWTARKEVDNSTGPDHVFRLQRTLRNRIVALAFYRQWAVNLLWLSPFGDLLHRALYSTFGHPFAAERALVDSMGIQSEPGVQEMKPVETGSGPTSSGPPQ